jgi:hypothetical protein
MNNCALVTQQQLFSQSRDMNFSLKCENLPSEAQSYHCNSVSGAIHNNSSSMKNRKKLHPMGNQKSTRTRPYNYTQGTSFTILFVPNQASFRQVKYFGRT